MTTGLALVAGVFLVAASGASVIWRKRHLAQASCLIDALIDQNRPTYKTGFDVADDGLRQRTLARRETAARMRSRAAHVESGASATTVLQLAKR